MSEKISTPRIIHIEDEPELTQGLSRAFSFIAKDMRLESWNDPTVALKKIDFSTPIDVIITDYQMPGMNGVELVRAMLNKIVQAGGQKPSLLVLFSAYDMEVAEKHVDMTFDLVISKPTRSRDIIEQIRNSLHIRDRYKIVTT